MKILLLDTSSKESLIGLADKDRLIHTLKIDSLQAQNIPAFVETLLQENGLSLDDIAATASGIGPGSYTGIRLSAIFAEALFVTRQIPLISFSSLDLFLPPKKGPFIVVRPSSRGKIFIQTGELLEGSILRYPPETISLNDLEQLSDKKQILATDIQKLQPLAPKLLWIATQPQLHAVLPQVRENMRKKSFTKPPLSLYYPPSCDLS
jgi:tRNA threonylcarbamoyl adenosine modification protein YeaZ